MTVKTIKNAAIACGALTAAYGAIGAVVYGAFLTRGGTGLVNKLLPPIDEECNSLFENSTDAKEGREWFDAAEKETVRAFTKDGRSCVGYFVNSCPGTHKYVICCHGYTDKPSSMGLYGKKFAEDGFSTLFPVFSGHDINESGDITMGWFDRLDVVAFAEYLAAKDSEAQIALHGVSMGGATVMMATGEKLPENVKCCVEDCGYTSAWDVFAVQIKNFIHLPIFPFLTAADTVARLKKKYNFKECSALNQVQKSVTPTLFIHGSRDTFVPFWMLHPLFERATCEKDKLIIDGAVHAVSALVNPEAYWAKVREFVGKYVD